MKYLLLYLIFISGTISYGQNQEIIYDMPIIGVKMNGITISENYEGKGQKLMIYANNNESLFANSSGDLKQQSFGRMIEVELVEGEETDSTYATTTITFKWLYFNTYDDESGTAEVEIIITDKPNGRAYVCNVLLENLDLYEFKGFLN